MITVNHLSKKYINPDGSVLTVLKDINCTIEKGEVISIIGPSGTGKSTLLRALNLLDPPTGGEILFQGENILAKGYPVHKLRQKMGMVFQSFNLFDHMTVLENVMFSPVKILGKSKEEAREAAMTLLRKVGVADKADVYPSSLSGGQKQRVAIESMRFEIKEIQKKLGITVVYVTHDQTEAMAMSDRIFLINRGVVQQCGTPEQIFCHPKHSATKAFSQRIRMEVFEVDKEDFDFLGMDTRMTQFCIKYNIAEKKNKAQALGQLLIPVFLETGHPLTIRLTYSELSGESSMDFMMEGAQASPLQENAAALHEVRSLCEKIVEEPTARGYRVRLLL